VFVGAGCDQPTTVTDPENTAAAVVNIDNNGYTNFNNDQTFKKISISKV